MLLISNVNTESNIEDSKYSTNPNNTSDNSDILHFLIWNFFSDLNWIFTDGHENFSTLEFAGSV